MSRMLWFGLLFVTALLLSLAGFIDADADGDSNVEKDTDSELPENDNVKKIIKLHPPRFADPVSIHEEYDIKEHIKLELPEPIFTFVNKENEHEPPLDEVEPEKLLEDDHHEQPENEFPGVEHMQQVAEDSEYSEQMMKEIDEETIAKLRPDVQDDKMEHLETEEIEIEGHVIEDGAEEKADDSLGIETADDKKRKEAIDNVEMLRRSDRSAVAGGKPKRRVFIKVIPPEQEHFYEVHNDDEVEHAKHEVVFLDPDSHAHVVHMNKDYATVVVHDDFVREEL